MIQNRNIVITNIRIRTTTISYINLNLIEKEDEQIDMIIENFRKSPTKKPSSNTMLIDIENTR